MGAAVVDEDPKEYVKEPLEAVFVYMHMCWGTTQLYAPPSIVGQGNGDTQARAITKFSDSGVLA